MTDPRVILDTDVASLDGSGDLLTESVTPLDHHDLDEPHRVLVAAYVAARLTRVRVDAGNPRLVPVPRQCRQLDDASSPSTVRCSATPVPSAR